MNREIFRRFVNAINKHDIDEIHSLLAEDQSFTDAHGNEVVGRDKMKAGWAAYFQLFPDYSIEITELFAEDELVLAFGFASGTFPVKKASAAAAHWRLPAAWKAIVRDGRIQRWQVYADTKIPFEIIEKNR